MFPYSSASELEDLGDQTVEELTVVADDDGRTVEGANGLLQHVLRGHVEVVGRLVEDKQVYWLEQQANHGQTTTLATAQNTHLLVGSLTTEHERTEDVVDTQTNLATRHAVDSVAHRQALVEQLCLVLGEVAYLNVMANFQRAVEGNLAHDALHQR